MASTIDTLINNATSQASIMVADPLAALVEICTFPGIALHLASITMVTAYLFRDQIVMRSLAVMGQLLFVVFYMFQPTGPLWEPVVWNLLISFVNTIMICVLLWECSMIRLSGDERVLHMHFDGLSRGELRRVLKRAEWVTVNDATRIIAEGQAPGSVYFLLDGRATVECSGRTFERAQGVFLGEISHLLQCPATATVTLHPGARYLCWSGEELTRIMRRADRIDRALRALLNRDMATKIATG